MCTPRTSKALERQQDKISSATTEPKVEAAISTDAYFTLHCLETSIAVGNHCHCIHNYKNHLLAHGENDIISTRRFVMSVDCSPTKGTQIVTVLPSPRPDRSMSFIRVQRHNLNINLGASNACRLPFSRLRSITLTPYFLLVYDFLFTLTLLGTRLERKTRAGFIT